MSKHDGTNAEAEECSFDDAMRQTKNVIDKLTQHVARVNKPVEIEIGGIGKLAVPLLVIAPSARAAVPARTELKFNTSDVGPVKVAITLEDDFAVTLDAKKGTP